MPHVGKVWAWGSRLRSVWEPQKIGDSRSQTNLGNFYTLNPSMEITIVKLFQHLYMAARNAIQHQTKIHLASFKYFSCPVRKVWLKYSAFTFVNISDSPPSLLFAWLAITQHHEHHTPPVVRTYSQRTAEFQPINWQCNEIDKKCIFVYVHVHGTVLTAHRDIRGL